jgi:hypothetical protein
MAFSVWDDDISADLSRKNPAASAIWKYMNALRAAFFVCAPIFAILFLLFMDLNHPAVSLFYAIAVLSLILYVLMSVALAITLGFRLWALLILVLSVPGVGVPAFVFRYYRAQDIREDAKFESEEKQ